MAHFINPNGEVIINVEQISSVHRNIGDNRPMNVPNNVVAYLHMANGYAIYMTEEALAQVCEAIDAYMQAGDRREG